MGAPSLVVSLSDIAGRMKGAVKLGSLGIFSWVSMRGVGERAKAFFHHSLGGPTHFSRRLLVGSWRRRSYKAKLWLRPCIGQLSGTISKIVNKVATAKGRRRCFRFHFAFTCFPSFSACFSFSFHDALNWILLGKRPGTATVTCRRRKLLFWVGALLFCGAFEGHLEVALNSPTKGLKQCFGRFCGQSMRETELR